MSNSQFVVGAVVIGQHFVVDVAYNDLQGEIIEVLGEMQVKGKSEDSPTETTECYMIRWVGIEEPDLIRKSNLKLVPPADSGEKSILQMFKVQPNKYNLEHYEDLKDEMARERVEELETTE
jgi:hypothetical protein